ncbi:hypothetical protein HaLaN_17630 [Haematococcus lacustris]|uniref:Uncharacterized protein n=1 Tax=Haematococcus lacustris TaxID=44745 RepID=A0A699ZQ16_HAELA|nr:hypothetical protein HaLaN_17630 [Haematococcus lacustris]
MEGCQHGSCNCSPGRVTGSIWPVSRHIDDDVAYTAQAVRLLGRPPPLGVRDFLHGKLRLLPDGTRGSALKGEMHGVIHYPLCASGACAINESNPLKPSLLHPQTAVA